jgi:hypothetical protein
MNQERLLAGVVEYYILSYFRMIERLLARILELYFSYLRMIERLFARVLEFELILELLGRTLVLLATLVHDVAQIIKRKYLIAKFNNLYCINYLDDLKD